MRVDGLKQLFDLNLGYGAYVSLFLAVGTAL